MQGLISATSIDSQVLRTLRALEPELQAQGIRHVSVFDEMDLNAIELAASDLDPLDTAYERALERIEQELQLK